MPNEPRTGAGVWRSRDLGFSFEADAGDSPSQEDGRSVTYQWNSVSGKLHAELHIEADPATETTPKGLLHRRRTTMADTILGLTEDTDPETMLDGPSIGFVPGVGGSYRGTLVSGSLDPDAPVVVAIFAASDRRITVVFSYAVTGYSNAADVLHVRRWADGILSSFEWRT